MTQRFSTAAKLFALTMVFFTASCKKTSVSNEEGTDLKQSYAAPLAPNAGQPDFQKLADTLQSRLKNQCVGYSLIVSYQGQYKTSRSGGFSRTASDFALQPFTMYTKFDIASVCKTITATALFKLMSAMPGGMTNLDMPIWPYLPSHWQTQLGPNIKTITFRELLTHTSGLRYDADPTKNGDDYQNLKNLFIKGINMSNKVYSYNNRNYGILRLIIPKLAQYNIITVSNNNPPAILMVLENTQAIEFADDYKDYCRQVIFNKLGTTATQTIDCVNTDTYPGLCYNFPAGNSKGYFSGTDGTMNAGAQEWVLSTIQINDFFTTLQYTQTLLPANITTMMKDQLLGYDRKGTMSDGTDFYWKNGVYDFGSPTIGSYRSLIIGFSDGIQITIMANSAIDLQDAAKFAHQDWHS